MNNLNDSLLHEYGSLMYDLDNCYDYFERIKIVEKMNAINVLLGCKKIERKNIYKLLK